MTAIIMRVRSRTSPSLSEKKTSQSRYCVRQAGTTLVELIIALLILSFVTASIVYVTLGTTSSIETHTSRGLLQSMLAEAIDRMTRDFQQTGTACPDWNIGTDSITFNRCTGYDVTVAQRTWGPPVTYSLSPDGELTRTENGLSFVLLKRVTDVDFQINDSLVSFAIEAEMPGYNQKMLSSSLSCSLFLNN